MSKPLLRLGGSRRNSSEGRAWRAGPGGVSRLLSAAAAQRCGCSPALIRTASAGRCPEGAEQSRVRNKLKRLIAKRPPLQTLQERGLLRGEVGWAGSPLCLLWCFCKHFICIPDLGFSPFHG